MHRLWLCVPMIALLLAGCGRLEVSEAEQLALEIRGEYLELERCSASLEITADYGQRVYQFEMDAQVQGEDAVLTLTAPETVAGLTARWAGEAGTLEYDGVAVETGSLDPEGLDPVSAFPVLLEAARSGYMAACALEEDGAVLRVDCGDPAGTPGTGDRDHPVVRRGDRRPAPGGDPGGRLPGDRVYLHRVYQRMIRGSPRREENEGFR